jgi:hypothetical protein
MSKPLLSIVRRSLFGKNVLHQLRVLQYAFVYLRKRSGEMLKSGEILIAKLEPETR